MTETMKEHSSTQTTGLARAQNFRSALEPLLVDAKQAAILCGISPASWHRLRSAGKIGPGPVRLGGRVLWRRAEIEAWVTGGCLDQQTWKVLQASQNGTGRK
jgi:predicted DNA-binding transcriptional regulator AlpA